MTKAEQIRTSLLNTRKKRLKQDLKVYELKVNIHHTSKSDFEKFNYLFVQTKWIQNDMIASNDIFNYNYKDHRIIINFDKDNNKITRNLTINTGIHQTIVKYLKQDIITLSHSKKKGNKIGKLKFRRTCNSIPMRTGMVKIKDNKTISIPHFKNLKVYGLDQIINLKDYELADARLIKKASGYYIKVSICTYKKKVDFKNKEIGLDFGIKDSITTSDGEKFKCSVQESDYLKFLQRKLTKKQKGSKRYYRCLNQIRKEHEYLSNKKNDDSNKLISYLLNNYDVIYFQNEQVSNWRRFNRNFAKNIQHAYLGRIKAKLLRLQKLGRSFEISKWDPSTKFCPQCGSINTGITLSDRIYKCDCGYEYDRDIHAAKNIKLFGSLKRVQCLEQTCAESLSSLTNDIMFVIRQDVEAKTEDIHFK